MSTLTEFGTAETFVLTDACTTMLSHCFGKRGPDEDNDGICDDVDTCVGVEDQRPWPDRGGRSITILYDSVYLPQLDEWYVYEFGADTTFTYTCAPFQVGCGESYHTITPRFIERISGARTTSIPTSEQQR